MGRLLRLGRLFMYTSQIRLVYSRCLHETTLEVKPIDRVYLRSSPSQLALSAWDNFKCWYDCPCIFTKSTYSTHVVYTRQLLKLGRLALYIYEAHLVNSICMHATILRVEKIVRVYYQVCLVNSRCLHDTTLNVEAIVRVYLPSLPSHLALFVLDNS